MMTIAWFVDWTELLSPCFTCEGSWSLCHHGTGGASAVDRAMELVAKMTKKHFFPRKNHQIRQWKGAIWQFSIWNIIDRQIWWWIEMAWGCFEMNNSSGNTSGNFPVWAVGAGVFRVIRWMFFMVKLEAGLGKVVAIWGKTYRSSTRTWRLQSPPQKDTLR